MKRNLGKKLAACVLSVTTLATTVTLAAAPAYAFTASNADTAMTAFNNAFWNSSKKLFWDDTNHSKDEDIWVQACEWDIVMDAYQRTKNPSYLTQLNEVYQGGAATYANFDWNNTSVWFANDDMLWWIIGMLRAYEITGNNTYLTTAKAGIDKIWSTEYDASDGGIWWTSVQHSSKNACAEGPFVIAACKLAADSGDSSYLSKAETVYQFQKSTLFDENTGSVADSKQFPSGIIDPMNFSYNQGTMIGAGLFLYQATNQSAYLTDAIKACNYLKNVMGDEEGILPAEMDMNDQGISKAIAVRYVMMLVNEGQTQYLPWLQKNADMAWAHRDTTRNLTVRDWNAYAGTGNIFACEAAGAADLLQVCPTNTSSANRDAYTVVEAESSDARTPAMSVDSGNGADKNLGGIQNNNYAEFKNVDFGSGGTNGFKARVSVNNDAGGFIDVRLDSPAGALLGTLNLQQTGSWGNYRYMDTDIGSATGVHDVYLIFRTASGYQYVCNLDKFYFVKSTAAVEPYRFRALEAAQSSGKSGTIGLGGSPEGGKCLNNIQNNTYVSFQNVDFGTAGAKAVNARIATSYDAGGTIEVRLDSTTGSLVGTLTAPVIGTWNDYATVTAELTGATGKHTVYFVFKTGAGKNYVCNFSYAEFKGINQAYEAEGSELSHNVGRAGGAGWSADTNADSAGFMIYGPYQKAAEGSRSIVYRMMIDNHSANNDDVVTIDVRDADTGTVLTQQTITRNMFRQDRVYQDFILNFSGANSTDKLEYRVYWNDKAYINVDKILVR